MLYRIELKKKKFSLYSSLFSFYAKFFLFVLSFSSCLTDEKETRIGRRNAKERERERERESDTDTHIQHTHAHRETEMLALGRRRVLGVSRMMLTSSVGENYIIIEEPAGRCGEERHAEDGRCAECHGEDFLHRDPVLPSAA